MLAWMRNQPALRQIPVFILTGSSEERDKAKARELGVKGYHVKPPQAAMLREAMKCLDA
jgi:CheY-like chemotaxis protein